jgi:hypothetical protein
LLRVVVIGGFHRGQRDCPVIALDLGTVDRVVDLLGFAAPWFVDGVTKDEFSGADQRIEPASCFRVFRGGRFVGLEQRSGRGCDGEPA